MNIVSESSKGPGIRERLIVLTRDVPHRDRSQFVLFVNFADTAKAFDFMNTGGFGDRLRHEGFVKGMKAMPMFLGITVLWNTSTTRIDRLENLSREDLLQVVESQRFQIETLFENRQRL